MKRVAIHFYKRALQVSIVLILLLATYVVAGRIVLPMLQDYRAVIERDLSEMLGVNIRIEEIEGGFRGFDPALVARHVDVLSGSGGPGFSSSIHLNSITVELDFFQTLKNRDLVFRELVVSGLELNVHQSSDGNWHLTGWESTGAASAAKQATANSSSKARPATDTDDEFNEILIGLLSLVERQDRIGISDTTLNLQPFEGQAKTLKKLQLDLYDLSDGRIQLDVRGRVGFQQDLHAMAIIGGEFDRLSSMTVEAYLSGNMLELAPWLSLIPEVSPPLVALNVKPELWLNWDGSQWELNGNIDIGHLEFVANQQMHSIADLAIDVSLRLNSAEQWQLWLNNIAFATEGYHWPETQIYAEGKQDGVIEVATPGFDLALIKNILLRGELLFGIAEDVVSTLNPEGRLEHIRFRYLPEQEDFEVSAHLNEVSVDAWGGAPFGRGINGIVHATKETGYLQLDSDHFTLGLPKLFREAWNYSDASGFLHWVIADNQYSLITENILLVGDEGEVHGQFRLDIPFDERPVRMGLQAGISNGDVHYAGKYIPVGESGLSEEVVSWLDKGLVKGLFNEGAFIMNGSLQDTDAINDFSFGLFFNVREAQIHYVDDWPDAENVEALVVINGDAVRVDATKGAVWGAEIKTLSVNIPSSPGGLFPTLTVQGKARSSNDTALRLLRESPIAEVLGGEAEYWDLKGDIDVGLDLSIPLGPGDDRYQVAIGFDDNQFALKREHLQLNNLTGVLNYDSARGLHSDAMDVTLLGSPAKIQALLVKGAPDTMQIVVDGRIKLDNLYGWLARSLEVDDKSFESVRELVNGETAYKGNLVISPQKEGTDVTLVVESPLNGVKVDVPQPLGKKAQEVRPLRLKLTSDTETVEQTLYTGYYGDLLGWRLMTKTGAMYGANLALGSRSPKGPIKRGVHVQGKIDELSLAPWIDWAGDRLTGDSDSASAYSVFIDDVRIKRLDAYDQQIDDLVLSGELNEKQHSLAIDSGVIKGTVEQKAEDSLYTVHLQHVHLAALNDASPEPVEGEGLVPLSVAESPPIEEDPWQAVDPREVPNINLTVDELKFGGEVWGNIAANFRPYDEGLHLFNVNGRLRYANIKGDLSWAYSNGIHRTYVKGDLELDNIADMLVSWGFPPSVTSKKGTFNYDLNWQGSPAASSEDKLQGSLDGELRKGQFVDTGKSTRALRVLGILNVNNISRRLQLDFSDLFSDGISYDTTTLSLLFDKGVIKTNEEMVVDGPGSDFKFSGEIDTNQSVIDAELVVTLPVTSTLPILGLILVNPVFGGAMLVFDQLLGDELQKFASVKYTIKGDLDNPEVNLDRLFGR